MRRAKSAWAGKGEPMRYAGAIPAFAEVDGLAAQRVMREEWQ